MGGVDFPGREPDIATGTKLLTGIFDNAIVVDLGSGDFEFRIPGSAFTYTKDPDLLAFYGLSDVQYNLVVEH